MSTATDRYGKIIESIFHDRYVPGRTVVDFERTDLQRTAEKLGISLPKNLGDIVYSFRYRAPLPTSILATAPANAEWIIRSTGRSRYRFALVSESVLSPDPSLTSIRIFDATPGSVQRYRLSEEQLLLARIRHNRLLDIFTGLTCVSLQTHVKTTVSDMGGVETDELYVGLDREGAEYVLPVQATGARERLHIVQIEQDVAMCAERFPDLTSRAIGAQFLTDGAIALMEFRKDGATVHVLNERHYRLVTY